MGNYNVVITYKKDMPIRSISYDKVTKKKMFDFYYNVNGDMIYANIYYNNGKIFNTLKLDSLPNRYACKIYFQNGILAGEGNVIRKYYKKHYKKSLKIGPWLYYKEDGSLYAYAEFAIHKKTEKEVLIDKKIIPKEVRIIKKDGKLINVSKI